MPKIINLGILAHVDAGKTTITEGFLYNSGAIKSPGNVDKGTAHTDYLDVEKARGISVRSGITTIRWNDTTINIVDTPGHIDFTAEVERSLSILDCAILVVSAVDGIQAQTEILWNALEKLKIPRIIFINKIDRSGSDVDSVISALKKEFSPDIIQVFSIENEEYPEASVANLWLSNNSESIIYNEIIESLASKDEELFEKFLSEETISFDYIDDKMKELVKVTEVFPLLAGSAKNNKGIEEMLDFTVDYFLKNENNYDKPLSAKVFKIEHNKKQGRIAWCRIFSGKITSREIVKNPGRGIEEKVNMLLKGDMSKYIMSDTAEAGEIVQLIGLSRTQAGDYLGKMPANQKGESNLRVPLLSIQVFPEKNEELPALLEALNILCDEDPALDLQWIAEEREINIKIMGEIQQEILEQMLIERFNIKASFGEATIIYKESPLKKAEGYVRYWMPKPCWAIIKFLIEPGERGSGIHYKSVVSINDVKQKYQNEVERTISEALKQGPLGWEVTDLKITMIEGEDHEVHSRPSDFVIATPMGIMAGLVNTSTQLLEPMLKVKISSEEEHLGKIMSQLIKMRADLESPEIIGEKVNIEAIVPLATSLKLPVLVSSITGGKGKYSGIFHSYRECSLKEGVKRDFKGISPLDTAKYILKARKALQ